jgi:Zn-dependent peptidase ImmA (M78 family)/DNA-binding XRE family transcriptional regulator
MIGDRIKRARKASGLSLRGLADKIGVSHTAINKFERGELIPNSGQLLLISQTLGVRSEFFLRSSEITITDLEYRKRSNLKIKVLNKIKAAALDQAERWIELLGLYPELPIKPFQLPESLPATITSGEDIENAAAAVRRAWNLGQGPIQCMIDTLESKGIIVVVTSTDGDETFDGFSAQANGQRLIVVSAHWPGDRLRFTLAHELGHLIIKDKLSPELNEEKACHHFAGALLLPRESIIESFGMRRQNLDPKELLLLKHAYGLSMQGCLVRAWQAAIISQKKYQNCFRQFSRNGWRKREPGLPYPSEQTVLFEKLVYRGLAESYFGESKAAQLLSMPLVAFRQSRCLQSGELLVCKC